MATAASRGAMTSLLAALDGPGQVVILPHDNPDPDALASAAALKYLVGLLLKEKPSADLAPFEPWRPRGLEKA